jgi:hypothetical protein
VSGSVVADRQGPAVIPEQRRPTPKADRPQSRIRTLRAFFGEVALIALLLSVYQLVRHLAGGHAESADEHATLVWHLERALFLPNEAAMQHWTMHWPYVSRLANLYYVGVHFPGTTVALAWLFLRHRAIYLRARTELVLLTSAGLVVHVLFPLAPPRLMPGFGTVDTMLSVGPSAYPAGDTGFANQYAAMPSLHVGWSILVALAVLRATDSRWRWLVLLHPALTTTVVLVTANHYWLDGIVAALLLGGAVLATQWLGPAFRLAKSDGGLSGDPEPN